MIPAYYDGMHLPTGDHVATWPEVRERFGTGEKRQAFCERLGEFLEQAKRCGFLRVYLFGSFISAKLNPGDVDLMWVHQKDLDKSSLARQCQELLDYGLMRARVGWDMWCCSDNPFVINDLMGVWRTDKSPARIPRGVVIIDLQP